MTNEEARAYFIDCNKRIASVVKDENGYNYEKKQIEDVFMRRTFEANELALKALEQTRWIPVSERLPEKEGEYLVTVSSFCGEIVFKCSFAMDLHKVDEYNFQEHKCGFYGIDSEWGSYEIDNVIAWMPLPQPYKAESEK